MSPAPDQVRRLVARGLVSVTLRGVAIRIIGLLGTLVLARLLSPGDFGVIALGLGIVTLGNFLADGGLLPGLIRRPEPPTAEELSALYGLQLCVFLVVLAVTAAVALPTGGDGGIVVTLMAASLVLEAAREPTNIVCERELEYRLPVTAEVLDAVVFNVLAVALVAAGLPLWGVGVATIVKALAGTAVLVLKGPVGMPRPSLRWRQLVPTLKFGVYFQGAWLAVLARDQGINLLLAGIAGTAALGAWALAQRLLSVLTTLFEAVWRVALPGMARLLESGEPPRPLLERSLAYAATAAGAPVVALVATGPALVPTLFGSGWGPTADVLPLVGLAALLAIPLGTVLTSLLWARDEPAKVFKMGIPSLAATLGTAAATMPFVDVQGAGLGLLAGGLVYVAGCLHYSRAEFGWTAVTRIAVPTLVAAAACALGWLVTDEVGDGVLAIAAGLAVGESAYFAGVATFDRRSLSGLTGMLRRTLVPRAA